MASNGYRFCMNPGPICGTNRHDSAFGGKLDCRIIPSLESLIYLNVFKAVHSPFQARNSAKFASSSISGIQKPESYSRLSISIDCFSKSSRVLDGRPGLRSLLSCESSSIFRWRYLVLSEIQNSNSKVNNTFERAYEFFQAQESLQRPWLRPGRTLSFALQEISKLMFLRVCFPYNKVDWPSLLLLRVFPTFPTERLPVVTSAHLCFSHSSYWRSSLVSSLLSSGPSIALAS